MSRGGGAHSPKAAQVIGILALIAVACTAAGLLLGVQGMFAAMVFVLVFKIVETALRAAQPKKPARGRNL